MYRLNDQNISWEKIDGEVIAIHYQTGCYYSLQGMAVHLWEQLMAGADLDSLCVAAGANAEEARGEIATFLDGLRQNDLLIEDAAMPPAELLAAPLGGYTPPVFEIHSDLQQLLLADPLHDVDETGWPALPPGATEVTA